MAGVAAAVTAQPAGDSVVAPVASIAAVADAPAAVDPAAADPAAVVAPVASTRPDEIPEDLWDATANAPKYADIKTRLEEGAALKAAAEAAATEIYTDAASIDWGASDVKGEDGAPIALDTEDPYLQAVAAVVVEHKIPKPAFNALLGAFLTAQLGEEAAAKASVAEEFAALGEPAAAQARVKGVQAFVQTAFEGDEKLKPVAAAKAAAFVRTLNSASQVEAIEQLMAHFKDPNPGAGGDGDVNASLRETNPGALVFRKKAA